VLARLGDIDHDLHKKRQSGGQGRQVGFGGPVIRLLCAAGVLLALTSVAPSADQAEIKIGYLHRAGHKETLSLVEMPADNNGLSGAALAVEDDNTTGRFLNQHFSLEDVRLKAADDPETAVAGLADRGTSLVLADLPAADLIKAADAGKARGLVFFNVGAIDDRLR